MKARLSMLAGFAIGAVLLYYAFRGIDFARLWGICRGVEYLYVLPLTVSLLSGLFMRGVKWKLLLDPVVKVRTWDAFRLEGAGLALNNVLPLRLGEIIRGTTGAKLFGAPVFTVFSTIVVERALDTIILILMLGAVAAAGGVSGGFLESGPYLWVLFGAVAAGMGVLVFAEEIMAHKLLGGFLGRFPRLLKLLSQLALGVKAFHSFRSGVLVFAAGLAQWLFEALNFYIVGLAFGLSGVLTPVKSVVLLFTGAVACSVPGMPGYFGNYEASIAAVLSSWGVSGETALAYAMLGHVVGYLIMTVIGLFFAYQMGHSLSKVWAQFGAGKKAGDGAGV